MITTIVKIEDGDVLETKLKDPAEIIKNGGLVAFPTETVYGLGASALNEDAARNIYLAKGRPSDNPLIIHISKPEEAEKYCYTNEIFYILAEKYMPGPLTVIMKKKKIIPYSITGGLDTVAVRCPSNKIANKLIEMSGVPIAAPSANTSGKPSPTKAEHVINDMNGKIDCIINGGDCEIGLESTIIKIENDTCTLLRPGGITVRQLKEVFSDIKIDKAVLSKLNENERPQAPGMKYRHYAPDAQIYLIIRKNENGFDEKLIDYLNEKAQKPGTGIIIPCDLKNGINCENIYEFGSSNDENEQAKQLYDILRTVDKSELKVVYAVINDKDDDLGLAIYNRMLKASGYNIIDL